MENSLLGSHNVHSPHAELWTRVGSFVCSVPEEAEFGIPVLLNSVWTGFPPFSQGRETVAELVGLLLKGQARKIKMG